MKLRHRLLTNLIRAHEFCVRFMTMLPYVRLTLRKNEAVNLRSAFNTIRLCNDLKLVPELLVDVGAADSQWATWLQKSFPSMRIRSFEPIMALHPIGEVHRYAIGDQSIEAKMIYDGMSSRISDIGDGTERVSVRRFDSFGIEIPENSILKVDAENYTARALMGFGQQLKEFRVVVVEMWNDYTFLEFRNQQVDIWRTMLGAGFTEAKMVDCEYAAWTLPCYDLAFYRP